MLTAERLRELLTYDPITGLFHWKVDHRCKVFVAGQRAGANSGRAIKIMIDKRSYFAHRLVWLYCHDKWPKDQIDHINRNPFDNRLANLRETTASQNQANRKLKLPASGFRGVYKYAKGERWFSYIILNKKRIFLGSFRSPEAASIAYRSAHTSFFGEFSSERICNADSSRANGLPAVV